MEIINVPEINGQYIIDKICERIRFESRICTDSEIVFTLSQLTNVDIAQLSGIGDIDQWIRDRNKSKDD